MKIVVFDIDGTLTETNEVDNRLFVESVRRVLRLDHDPDLFGFDDATDSAILRGLSQRHSVRPYEEVEADVQGVFFELLEEAASSDTEAFRPIPGARSILRDVREAGWTPAMATGCWRRSADLKLRVAGIEVEGVPIASASDFPQRRRILSKAIEDAGGDQDTPAVYVGDGVWDITASNQLGLGFLGRGEGAKAQELREHGAETVVADFTDSVLVLRSLEIAANLDQNAV